MATKNVVALNRAIEVLGGQSALARACGVKQGHVWHWLNKSRKVPGDYVLTIEAATNGAVTRYELRPDIFGKPNSAQHAKVSVKKELPFPGARAVSSEELSREQILARIIAAESRQHRAMREMILGKSGAADHLAKVDAEIAALRSKLSN
jgi:DNA-binding transcriptional regulator YdaS (Cro superfamily)